MKVLVDTCIWSHALRSRKPEYEALVKSLETLIAEQRVLIIGAIRQEVLSGYSDHNKFEILKAKLNYFENHQSYSFIFLKYFIIILIS